MKFSPNAIILSTRCAILVIFWKRPDVTFRNSSFGHFSRDPEFNDVTLKASFKSPGFVGSNPSCLKTISYAEKC